MKNTLFLWIFLYTCLFINQPKAQAQQTNTLPTDSISVEALLNFVEANSSYRIYTDIDTPFNVLTQGNQKAPLSILKDAFITTPYEISIYKNMIFILKGKKLDTYSYFSFLKNEKYSIKEITSYIPTGNTEKANSENKIYAVGDPYLKNPPPLILLKGKVTDSKTGDPLPNIKITLKETNITTSTDQAGNYSIKLPSGRIQLEISGFNVKESRRQLMLYGDGTLNIELIEEAYQLGEVLVTSGRIDNVKGTQIGVEKLQIKDIKNIPTAFGEVDILRVIQTLPGVKTVGEASTGYNVRGGATDQNLILFNNGTIYNPNHLFGFFTAFSSEIVKEAELYKSSIPSKYGGRISSVLDITGQEANKEKLKGSAGIGLVTGKLNLEIPIVKEKSSLLLSGRTTYSDWILKQLPKESGYNDGTANFYDVAMVFSQTINTKNSLNLYGYYSHDQYSFSKTQKYAYNNMNASSKWKSIFSEKLIGTFAIGYDHYDYENKETTYETEAYKLSFNINQAFGLADFSYFQGKHRIDFGFKLIHYNTNPGNYEPQGAISLIKKDLLQKEKALESALYMGYQWDINPKLSINTGIRYSIFNALGPRTYYEYDTNLLPYESTIIDTVSAPAGQVIKTYLGPEFRLAVRYMLNNNLSVKTGFNTMRQYIHKLSNTVIMSPTDTWKLSDTNILPQKGWQIGSGLYFDLPHKDWETSVEVYYKKMRDYLDYRSGAQIVMNHHIETDVINTEGYAYGVELSVKKITGKLTGWASYTYSRTFLRQSDKLISNPINNGDWYPTDYDKPNDFKLIGNYKLTQRYSFSLNMDYSTGRPVTIPKGKYYDETLNATFVYFTDRNSYRIPDYFRMDFSFNIEPSHKLSLLAHHMISFGVYNLTGRNNVYSIYYVSEGGQVKGYQMSIFGSPIPYITYNIKF